MRKRRTAAQNTEGIDTSSEFSQLYLEYKSRGWKKMFLDCLLVYKKKWYKKIKLWCYFIVWMPHTPTSTTHLFFPLLTWPSTHSLSSLSSAYTFHPCFIGVSAVTCDVKSPRVCSPLCSDHLWQMRVLCVQHVAPLSSCYHPPFLYH